MDVIWPDGRATWPSGAVMTFPDGSELDWPAGMVLYPETSVMAWPSAVTTSNTSAALLIPGLGY